MEKSPTAGHSYLAVPWKGALRFRGSMRENSRGILSPQGEGWGEGFELENIGLPSPDPLLFLEAEGERIARTASRTSRTSPVFGCFKICEIVHLTEDCRKSGRDAALRRPRPYSGRNEISKSERFFPTGCAAERGADSARAVPTACFHQRHNSKNLLLLLGKGCSLRFTQPTQ